MQQRVVSWGLSEMDRIVAVVGAHDCSRDLQEIAFQVGVILAQSQFTVACGGRGGVMAAVCQGAKSRGGRTVGILPDSDGTQANPWVDVAIATGMGEARNAILVNSAQAVIAIAGGYGTLSEIAFALKAQKPLIGIQTWDITPRLQEPPRQQKPLFPMAASAPEAVAWVAQRLQREGQRPS